MNVIYEDRLREYMLRKGHAHILYEMYAPNFADAAPEVHGRFIGEEELRDIKARGCHAFVGDIGEVLVTVPCVEFRDTITLGLRSFLFIKDPTIKGMVTHFV